METIPSKQCPNCGAQIDAEAPQGLCPKCLLQELSLPTNAGSSPAASAPSLEALKAAFPHLEILGFIGRGGMGFVFKARQQKLERFVALKILPESLAADPAFAERFTREGRVLARLSHPNIVTVHDFGQAHGFVYLLMEFVDGVNLRQAMRAGRFTPEQALAIVPSICEALQFAHSEGILHRDIKPENILLDSRGRVKIADFGIAKILGGDAVPPGGPDAAQNTTGPIGTPQYMAPEQLEQRTEVDHRADIYSLGVVFYEMLTGELPIGRFAPPSEKSTADPRLDRVVLQALEREPEHRTRSAAELKTQVENVGAPPVLPPAGAEAASFAGAAGPSAFYRSMKRGWRVAAAVFLLVVLGAVAVSLILPKSYVAKARVLVREPADKGFDPFHIQTEFERIKSAPVLLEVADVLDLPERWGAKMGLDGPYTNDQLLEQMRASLQIVHERNTSVLEIRYYSDSPREAAEIANRIVETYRALPQATGASIIEPALPASRPIRPNIPLNIFVGVVAGILLGALIGGMAALISYLRLKSNKGSMISDMRFDRRVTYATVAVAVLLIGVFLFLQGPEPHTRSSKIPADATPSAPAALVDRSPAAMQIEESAAPSPEPKGKVIELTNITADRGRISGWSDSEISPGERVAAVFKVPDDERNLEPNASKIPPGNQFEEELARLKLTYAEHSLKEARAEYAVGRIDSLALEKAIAERDIAVAEMNGKEVDIAEIRLKIADMELRVAEKKHAVGAITGAEVAQARLARDRAEIILRQQRAEARN